MTVLTVNVGSSSVKLASFDHGLRKISESSIADERPDPAEALRRFIAGCRDPFRVVAHRVVHGGDRFSATCRIDAAVERGIAELAELAPLHNPPALAWIRAARKVIPSATHVAAFDTAFFARLPRLARRYAISEDLAPGAPLHRFGFHGLAHRHLWLQWQRMKRGAAGGRLISLQLGAGCSIAAIRDAEPVDTSMGFTPLEGLVMATRCGDLDPGLLLYLQRRRRWSARKLEEQLNERSGLLGVSGLSGDVRQLMASETPESRFALDLFCYRARKYVGAYLAVLGGADGIAFGGGIGEHVPQIRAQILSELSWAGITIDARRNLAATHGSQRISAESSSVDLCAIAVEEAQVLAQEAAAFLA